jgi:hypothetical protein
MNSLEKLLKKNADLQVTFLDFESAKKLTVSFLESKSTNKLKVN